MLNMEISIGYADKRFTRCWNDAGKAYWVDSNRVRVSTELDQRIGSYIYSYNGNGSNNNGESTRRKGYVLSSGKTSFSAPEVSAITQIDYRNILNWRNSGKLKAKDGQFSKRTVLHLIEENKPSIDGWLATTDFTFYGDPTDRRRLNSYCQEDKIHAARDSLNRWRIPLSEFKKIEHIFDSDEKSIFIDEETSDRYILVTSACEKTGLGYKHFSNWHESDQRYFKKIGSRLFVLEKEVQPLYCGTVGIPEAAKILGMKPKTLWLWGKKGKLNLLRTPHLNPRITPEEISRLKEEIDNVRTPPIMLGDNGDSLVLLKGVASGLGISEKAAYLRAYKSGIPRMQRFRHSYIPLQAAREHMGY